ncbi:MAG: preprotein translocase subunit SecE [Oscillospiraceae bacterium]|jgi:preprotein translocase subunit SecE|nr:preprotein translocase subunit SecE [Oscillospiraceae bacterium]
MAEKEKLEKSAKPAASAKAVASAKTAKVAKPGKKFDFAKFLREYRSELKKVSWPTWKQVVNNTLITIAFMAVVGLFIWVFDFGLSQLRDWVLSLAQNT